VRYKSDRMRFGFWRPRLDPIWPDDRLIGPSEDHFW